MTADPIFALGRHLVIAALFVVAYGIGCLVGERLYQAWRRRRLADCIRRRLS